jgi:hypothetical protein
MPYASLDAKAGAFPFQKKCGYYTVVSMTFILLVLGWIEKNS